MIVNRAILKNHKLSEYDIKRILERARKLQIAKDRMTKDIRGHFVSAPHFDINEWIERQSVWMESIRPDWVNHNKKLLRLVEIVRDRIIKENSHE